MFQGLFLSLLSVPFWKQGLWVRLWKKEKLPKDTNLCIMINILQMVTQMHFNFLFKSCLIFLSSTSRAKPGGLLLLGRKVRAFLSLARHWTWRTNYGERKKFPDCFNSHLSYWRAIIKGTSKAQRRHLFFLWWLGLKFFCSSQKEIRTKRRGIIQFFSDLWDYRSREDRKEWNWWTLCSDLSF